MRANPPRGDCLNGACVRACVRSSCENEGKNNNAQAKKQTPARVYLLVSGLSSTTTTTSTFNRFLPFLYFRDIEILHTHIEITAILSVARKQTVSSFSSFFLSLVLVCLFAQTNATYVAN